jgi:hypothetical protein
MGIFNEMYAQAFPTTHPMMYLAFEVECSQSELGRPVKMEIRLAGADGEQVFTVTADAVFATTKAVPQGERPRTPQVMGLAGLQFPKASEYTFSIFVNGDLKKETSFKLSSHPAAGSPGLSSPPGGLRR